MRRVGWVVAGLVSAALLVSGCTAVPTVDTGPATSTTGGSSDAPPVSVDVSPRADPVAVGKGWAFTTKTGGGSITVYSAVWHADTGGQFANTPTNGGFLVLDVAVDVTSGSYLESEYDWSLKDSTDRVWPCLGSYWFPPGLPDGQVRTGTTVRGNIVCDAPKTAGVVQVKGDLGWVVPAPSA